MRWNRARGCHTGTSPVSREVGARSAPGEGSMTTESPRPPHPTPPPNGEREHAVRVAPLHLKATLLERLAGRSPRRNNVPSLHEMAFMQTELGARLGGGVIDTALSGSGILREIKAAGIE